MTLNIPKKYQERFKSLEAEDGLIDDCKYILTFARGWAWEGFGNVPVRSKKEAIEYLKEATGGHSSFTGVMDCWA